MNALHFTTFLILPITQYNFSNFIAKIDKDLKSYMHTIYFTGGFDKAKEI